MARQNSTALKIESSNSNRIDYEEPTFLSMKTHPQLSELWLQDRIAEKPEILGLGEVIVVQRERRQPRAGRLDLLLADADGSRRYTVELQLGSVDESHIIRTIEYWDSERRRYPNIEHCAVICAEEITGRFLNVISLFNGTIPLIVLQVKAVQIGQKTSLLFTKVLDEVQLGPPEDVEISTEVSRSTWEQASSKEALILVDGLVNKLREIVGPFDIKFNKHYIGCVVAGRPANFINFKPQKSGIRLDLSMKLSSDQIEVLESAGIEVMTYSRHWKVHPIRLTNKQAESPPPEFFEIVKIAFDEYFES